MNICTDQSFEQAMVTQESAAMVSQESPAIVSQESEFAARTQSNTNFEDAFVQMMPRVDAPVEAPGFSSPLVVTPAVSFSSPVANRHTIDGLSPKILLNGTNSDSIF